MHATPANGRGGWCGFGGMMTGFEEMLMRLLDEGYIVKIDKHKLLAGDRYYITADHKKKNVLESASAYDLSECIDKVWVRLPESEDA